MRSRLTPSASRDIDTILSASRRLFGPQQARRYAAVIDAAINMVAEDMRRPGSKSEPGLGPEVRRFHLQFAARRQGGAAHVLFYRPSRSSGGDPEVLILRVLGDEMDPRGRVAYALRGTGS